MSATPSAPRPTSAPDEREGDSTPHPDREVVVVPAAGDGEREADELPAEEEGKAPDAGGDGDAADGEEGGKADRDAHRDTEVLVPGGAAGRPRLTRTRVSPQPKAPSTTSAITETKRSASLTGAPRASGRSSLPRRPPPLKGSGSRRTPPRGGP